MSNATKILAPIDFSACSKNALGFAIKLAGKINATIEVLNVPSYDTGISENPTFVASAIENVIKESEKHTKAFIQKVTESVHASLEENPRIETKIEIGKVSSKICDIAARNQIDYIVMGTQGANSNLDNYFGSNTSNVLKSSPCPVFVIPEQATFPNEIILGYASDFMDADPFGIWKTVKLLDPFQPEIKYVHFDENKDFHLNKIKELESYFSETTPDLKISFHNLPVKGNVSDMNDFIKESNINMLAMYKPNRSFFESLFHISFTKKMALHIEIPILVLKEEN